eukprot:scaffold41167_cov14-Tisochrysis_lutea.AAC.1
MRERDKGCSQPIGQVAIQVDTLNIALSALLVLRRSLRIWATKFTITKYFSKIASAQGSCKVTEGFHSTQDCQSINGLSFTRIGYFTPIFAAGLASQFFCFPVWHVKTELHALMQTRPARQPWVAFPCLPTSPQSPI